MSITATSNQQPATSNQQPATSNQQPATSNQQPATSNQQPATSNQQPATSNPYKYLSIGNVLFFLAFLLTLSIIAYCDSNTAKFDPTCTNGTASTEKVSVENTENCTVCTTKGYALTKVGDFMECRTPYICTNGEAIDGGAITVTENCASCDTDTDTDYALTKVGDFMECRTPYICTNGEAIDGGAITVTKNCASCDVGTDYVLTKVGDFMECRIPYICTNGDPAPASSGTTNTVTENCASCDTDTDYALTEVGDFMECRIPYICTNGDPAPASSGTTNTTTENCASCNRHYGLDSMQCVALDTDGDTILDINDVDADGDGLIEIYTLNDLATIQYDLDGNGSDDDISNMRTLGITGCGGLNTLNSCTGYELMQNLDFRNSSSYATVNTDWLPDPSLLDNTSINLNFSSLAEASTNAGWIPIGSSGNTFSATFEGNGFTISNLYVRRSARVGFFGETSSSSKIRNIGLVDGAVFGGSGVGNDGVGGLVGNNNGSITASYATGSADGGDDDDLVGGLVGYNTGSGSITASYATGDGGGGGGNDRVGGLVGYNTGSIIASYATGDGDGGGDGDFVGGLVGVNGSFFLGRGGIITASYATGNVGGLLVGANLSASSNITDSNSYSVMDAKGLTSDSLGTIWNFVWDFGTLNQPPALRYADYDGTDMGSIDYCGEIFPVNVVCGTTLLPGQGR